MLTGARGRDDSRSRLCAPSHPAIADPACPASPGCGLWHIRMIGPWNRFCARGTSRCGGWSGPAAARGAWSRASHLPGSAPETDGHHPGGVGRQAAAAPVAYTAGRLTLRSQHTALPRFGGWLLSRLAHPRIRRPLPRCQRTVSAMTHPGPTELLPPGRCCPGSPCRIRGLLRPALSRAQRESADRGSGRGVRCLRLPSPAARSPRPGPPSVRSSGWGSGSAHP